VSPNRADRVPAKVETFWMGWAREEFSSMSSSKTLPRPTRSEAKADITDRAAREIIDAETNARDNRIARLRSLRLQSEAAERAAPKAKPAPKARKKAS
jgi:hypothetical protein